MNKAEKTIISKPSDLEVEMTRGFDAPRGLVFDAFTRPELLRRWMDAPGRTLEVCDIDLKVGGAYRFVWRGPGKADVGTYGIYREVRRPERFVRSESWEDWDAGELLVTTILTEQHARTTLTSTILFPSMDVRDQLLKSGMEHGIDESFDKLAEVLAAIT